MFFRGITNSNFFPIQLRQSESKTIFELSTHRLAQLPIVDFQPEDYGLPHQAFGFEVGAVCFK